MLNLLVAILMALGLRFSYSEDRKQILVDQTTYQNLTHSDLFRNEIGELNFRDFIIVRDASGEPYYDIVVVPDVDPE